MKKYHIMLIVEHGIQLRLLLLCYLLKQTFEPSLLNKSLLIVKKKLAFK